MSVILCRRERVSHPFFIESLGIRVGSSQELCYAFYHHPLLLIDDLMGQDLMDFIREELGMGATAGRMEKWIRSGENPLGRIIPILAMTANAFLEDMQKSKEAGMDEHLSKPVDISALEQTVKRFRVTPPPENK